MKKRANYTPTGSGGVLRPEGPVRDVLGRLWDAFRQNLRGAAGDLLDIAAWKGTAR